MKKFSLFLVVPLLAVVLSGCSVSTSDDLTPQNNTALGDPNMPQPENTQLQTATELITEDVTVGDGQTAEPGDSVTVHYVGTLTDGTPFDSSRDRGTPFTFDLGAQMVIQGWDEGVVGMQEGGVRKLTIPAHMAYGERGVPGAIPPNATLLFEVELLEVAKAQ